MSGDVAPFRVGYLDEGAGSESRPLTVLVREMLAFRFDEARESGEIDRPVEVVERRGVGLPHGTAKAVCDAWHALADDGALVIIGPGITDNCIAVRPHFEARGVPTINFPGTMRSRGRYGFHYQVGALYGDGPLLARALARRDLREVAVIRDRSPIGAEFFEFFEAGCERAGVAVIADVKCSPIAENLEREAERARATKPDALVYLGYGGVLLELSRALTRIGWDPPRFTTSAGMHFLTMTPEEKQEMGSWVYVDMVDEGNATFAAMLDRFEARTGTRPFHVMSGAVYDMATLAVLGLANATLHTPEGVAEGLERIHHVPSALGGEGTTMGFGPWERTALKGPDYLVLRQMQGVETVKYLG